jgi:hypothetical protein
MTKDKDSSPSINGRKRNLFRGRKQTESGSGSEQSTSSGAAQHGKLRWAQHLGQRSRSLSEDGVHDDSKSHSRKLLSGKKLHWSPRLSQNAKSHADNDATAAEVGDTHKDEKVHFGLHWSPRFGHKNTRSNTSGEYIRSDTAARKLDLTPHHDGFPTRGAALNNVTSSDIGSSRDAIAGDEASSDMGSSRNGYSRIPRQVLAGGSSGGSGLWEVQSNEASDVISDDFSEEDPTKKEKAAKSISRIRHKLSIRKSKKTHWHRIDEDEVHQLPLGDELDSHEGFYARPMAGDLEMSKNDDSSVNKGRSFAFNRGRSSTEPVLAIPSLPNDGRFLRPSRSMERNTSPRILRSSGSSEHADIISLRGSHTESTDTVTNRGDSDVMSLGASVGGPSILREESPVGKRKGPKKHFRVKPAYCFDHPVYMTDSEIHQLMLQPSRNVQFLNSYIKPSSKRTKRMDVRGETERIWGKTDDGRVGSLRVEVLGCMGLAPLSPDVSVYLICGDVPFATDVIPSCRSPRWPPNCRRAAVFPVHHAYARLYAGVFASKKDKSNDDFCGRVVIDLAALRPNTEYDVTLPLRASSFVYDRRPRGVIRLRFSLHWFSERAAVWSYLKNPRSLVDTPFGNVPSILCGDPKTFRNVAITVHGQDLPGKFTRKAFQATMREFNLTRLNLIFLAKTLATDTVLYERPLMSLYIFMTWMHCVYTDSVKLAPAYFVGFLIFFLFNNYETFNRDESRYLGYDPPTIQELLYAMVSRAEQEHVRPLLVEKNISRKSQRNPFEKQSGYSQDLSGDIEPLDHREFPFSDKLEYPRFRPEDAIVQSKHTGLSKTTTPDHYLYGRLTEYASEKMSSLQSVIPTPGSDDEDRWELSEDDEDLDLSDSDHMHNEGDNVFIQSDDEADNDEGLVTNTGAPIAESRRRPIGPPQDCDVKPIKTVPPHVMLARAENTLHSLTFGLSMDRVFHSSLAVGKRLSSIPSQNGDSSTGTLEPSDANTKSRRNRRSLLDDFDKRLGFRTSSKNPVLGITASFLGPIMRMFRIFLIATRVVFNIGVWRDPFLSFWVLCFLVALMFILLIFPWRCFMFFTGLVCFGPQNILLRRRLLCQAAEREKKEEEELQQPQQARETDQSNTDNEADAGDEALGDEHSRDTDGTPGSESERTSQDDAATEDDSIQKKEGRRNRLKKKLATMKEKRRLKKQESLKASEPEPLPPRPAFRAVSYFKPSKIPLESREVVVPYTRVRTERFYDWPPDPSVSRASPVFLAGYGLVDESSFAILPANEAGTPRNYVRRRIFTDL